MGSRSASTLQVKASQARKHLQERAVLPKILKGSSSKFCSVLQGEIERFRSHEAEILQLEIDNVVLWHGWSLLHCCEVAGRNG